MAKEACMCVCGNLEHPLFVWISIVKMSIKLVIISFKKSRNHLLQALLAYLGCFLDD